MKQGEIVEVLLNNNYLQNHLHVFGKVLGPVHTNAFSKVCIFISLKM